MERFLPALIVGLVVVLVFVVMWRAWRARRASTPAEIWSQDVTWPDHEPLESVQQLFYVATTFRDKPLDRVLPPGLGFRGNARLDIHAEGVVIRVTGERPFAIAAEHILGCSVQQLTIDKVVERDGLVALAWRSPVGELTSVFRVKNAAQRARLLNLNQPNTHVGETLD